MLVMDLGDLTIRLTSLLKLGEKLKLIMQCSEKSDFWIDKLLIKRDYNCGKKIVFLWKAF